MPLSDSVTNFCEDNPGNQACICANMTLAQAQENEKARVEAKAADDVAEALDEERYDDNKADRDKARREREAMRQTLMATRGTHVGTPTACTAIANCGSDMEDAVRSTNKCKYNCWDTWCNEGQHTTSLTCKYTQAYIDNHVNAINVPAQYVKQFKQRDPYINTADISCCTNIASGTIMIDDLDGQLQTCQQNQITAINGAIAAAAAPAPAAAAAPAPAADGGKKLNIAVIKKFMIKHKYVFMGVGAFLGILLVLVVVLIARGLFKKRTKVRSPPPRN